MSGGSTIVVSFASITVAPIMAGKANRNEYLKAADLFTFWSSPVATVMPLLEMPGIIVKICTKPITNELCASSFLFPILFSETNSTQPVSNRAIPTAGRFEKSDFRKS